MTSFEEKPIVFLDYPFSLNAPMAKKVRTIKSTYFGKEGLKANPALGKDGREEAMGTGEESSKPVYSLARPIC